MRNAYKAAVLAVGFTLVGCGGDDGGGGAINLPQVNSIGVDCNGAKCASGANNTYKGSGVGIWRYVNNGANAVNLNVSLSNVSGKEITIVLTNTKDTDVNFITQSTGGSNVGSGGGDDGGGVSLAGDIAFKPIIFNDMPDSIKNFNASAILKKAADKGLNREMLSASISQQVWQQGAKKDWWIVLYNNSNVSRTATLLAQSQVNGTTINFWVQDSEYGAGKITSSVLSDFVSKFTNNIYANVVNIAGMPWGTHSYSDLIPWNNQVNVVFANFENPSIGGRVVGYFYPLNNIKGVQYSNEEVALFLDAETIYKSSNGEKTILSTMAHEFTHTIGFYQRDVLLGVDNEFHVFLKEMTAIMMEDIIAHKLDPSYNDVRESNYYQWFAYGNLVFNCDFTLWGDDGNYCGGQSFLNYAVAGSFGAYLLRQYGLDFYVQLLQQTSNINDQRAQSIAILNQAISDHGGGNLATALSRWGAGISRFDAANVPAKYGYPALNDSYGNVSYTLVGFNKSDAPQPTMPSRPQTLKAHGHYPIVKTSHSNNFQEIVQVPSGVTVSIVVK